MRRWVFIRVTYVHRWGRKYLGQKYPNPSIMSILKHGATKKK